MRRAGQSLDIMAIGLFVGGLVILVAMFVSPGGFTSAVMVQIHDYDPPIQASTVNFYLDQEYTNDSINDSVYRGMYRRGRAMGIWGQESVDTENEAMLKLQREIVHVFQNEYLGAMTSGAGCRLAGISGIQILVDEQFQRNGEDWMLFPVEPNGEPRAECRSQQSEAAGGRSLHAVEFLALPPERELANLRYRTLYRAASDVAEDEEFQELLKTAEKSSHTAAIDSCEESTDEECGWDPPSGLTLEDDRDIENEQEQNVIDELKPLLDDIAADVESDYEDVSVEVTIEEMEFIPYNIQLVDGFPMSWWTDCAQSDRDTWTEYTPLCGAEDCPDDGSCSLDHPDEWCRDYCSNLADKPDNPDPIPSDSGEWTDDVWHVEESCRYGYADPRPYGGDPQVPVAHRGSVLPFQDRVRAQTCTPTCQSSQEDCVENLGSSSRTRWVWTFDLRSFTRVQVNVTDLRNRVPTRDGFRHPEFIVHYEELHETPR